MRRFLGAVQFLTLVPIHTSTPPLGQCAAFFPIVGAAIGWGGAAVLMASEQALGRPIAALLAVAFWVIIGGGLHEDGLADVADAFRAGRTPERILAILKDSRIGTFGALALGISLLLRWQAIQAMALPVLPVMVASQAMARAATVALAWISRPVGTGLGAQFSSTLSTPSALIAILLGVAPLAFLDVRAAVAMGGGAVLILWQAREWFNRRIGGVTGDSMGATAQIVEIYILLVAACRTCIS